MEAEGVLGKEEGGWRFTRFVVRPRLKIAEGKDLERAKRLLEKAEKTCLVARSLACPTVLEPEIAVEENVPELEKMGNSVSIS